MKQRVLVLSLLALAALVVAACGSTAATPEAAQPTEAVLESGGSDEMAKDDTAAEAGTADEPADMMKDDPDEMAKEDTDSMAKDEMDEMAKEDTAAEAGTADETADMMKEDPDAAAKDDADSMKMGEADSMEKDDAGATMAEESDAMSKDDSTGSMDEDAMMDLPSWFSAELTDVNSGDTLTVADLKGKVVLVETMAIWCSNCLRQQKEVKALHEALGMEDGLVTLVLDIDPNENAEHLRDYAAKHGFDWTYVVAPREVAREIGQLYGDQFLNPPSTPMLIVDRHGEVHLLPFGRKSAEDLHDALTPFLNEDM